MKREGNELVRAFKTPSLRNVAERPPYMHAGQYETLKEVLQHYKRAPKAPAGTSEIHPLNNLTASEIERIEIFLKSLSGPLAVPAELLEVPALPD